MTKALSMALLMGFAFCATHANAASLDVPHPKELLEKLFAEVNSGGWELKQSLPELTYAKEYYFLLGQTIDTTNLLGADRRSFTVLVIKCPSMSFPGDNFMLAYLRDPTGVIVDWKSQWLYNREGNLTTKVLDVNYDGVPDFCFVCEPFRRPEQLLSAFCVRNGKFEPVIAEHKEYFDVEFQETDLEGDIVIQPQLKGRYGWQTDKLYEIPVKVLNRSQKPIDLRGRYIRLTPSFYGSGSYGGLSEEALRPGSFLNTTITVRFSRGCADQKFGFELTPRHESP
jgi:hypothetical protein